MKSTKRFPSCTAALGIFLLLGAFGACKDDSTSPTGIVTNAPVIASATNAFAYVMMADGFTASVNYDLNFTTDSLAYSMVVSNWGSGSTTFLVVDPSGSTIIRDSVFTSKVSSLVQSGKGIPKRCTLSFQNFTGGISLSLAANQARH